MPIYESESLIKLHIVLEIGTAYTKLGFSGECAPRFIIKSEVRCKTTNKMRQLHAYDNQEDLYDMLVEFIQMIYFKYALVSPKDKPIVLVESILCPTLFRATLAKVLFCHYEVSAIWYLPSHLTSLAPLEVDTALVLDIGYTEAVAVPICYGYPVLHAWEALPIGAQHIHKKIMEILSNDNLGVQNLGEEVLEDIKVRCCFVTKSERAANLLSTKPSITPCPEVIYPYGGNKMLKISGKLRETAMEVLYNEDVDSRCLTTMILDVLLKVNIDLRLKLAGNILLTGGTVMTPGFKARLKAELQNQLLLPKYKKLKTESFVWKFHNPPCKDNYTSWLGGAIYSCTELFPSKALTRDQYMKEKRVPDWSNMRDNIRGSA